MSTSGTSISDEERQSSMLDHTFYRVGPRTWIFPLFLFSDIQSEKESRISQPATHITLIKRNSISRSRQALVFYTHPPVFPLSTLP